MGGSPLDMNTRGWTLSAGLLDSIVLGGSLLPEFVSSPIWAIWSRSLLRGIGSEARKNKDKFEGANPHVTIQNLCQSILKICLYLSVGILNKGELIPVLMCLIPSLQIWFNFQAIYKSICAYVCKLADINTLIVAGNGTNIILAVLISVHLAILSIGSNSPSS